MTSFSGSIRHGPPVAAPWLVGPKSEPELAGAFPSTTGIRKSVTGPVGGWPRPEPESTDESCEKRLDASDGEPASSPDRKPDGLLPAHAARRAASDAPC